MSLMDAVRPAFLSAHFLRFTCTALALLHLYGLNPVHAGIIDDLKAKQARVRTVSARFTQEKHSRLLSKPIRSGGTFAFLQPDRIRWEYRGNIHMLVLYTGRELWIYYPELREAELVRGMLEYTALMHFDIDRMSRDHEMTASREKETTRLVFTPKRKGPVALIEMDFAGEASFPYSLRLTDSSGEMTRITFRDVVLNGEINEGLFTFVPDSTVRVRERVIP